MSHLNILVGDTVRHLRNFKEGVFDTVICILPINPYQASSVPINHETLGFYYNTLAQEFKRILHYRGSIWLLGKYDTLVYAPFFLKEQGFYFINHVCVSTESYSVSASRSLKNNHYMVYWMKPHKNSPHIYNGSELSDIWYLEPKEVYKEIVKISCNEDSPILLPFYDHVAFNSCSSLSPNVVTIKAE